MSCCWQTSLIPIVFLCHQSHTFFIYQTMSLLGEKFPILPLYLFFYQASLWKSSSDKLAHYWAHRKFYHFPKTCLAHMAHQCLSRQGPKWNHQHKVTPNIPWMKIVVSDNEAEYIILSHKAINWSGFLKSFIHIKFLVIHIRKFESEWVLGCWQCTVDISSKKFVLS